MPAGSLSQARGFRRRAVACSSSYHRDLVGYDSNEVEECVVDDKADPGEEGHDGKEYLGKRITC